jgi:FSR family fosmidomycin resistance protein-like MFS transporter
MTTSQIAAPQIKEDEKFQTGAVATVVGGHFTHDSFTAFVAPLLPLVIEKLSLTLTRAGALTALMQFPAILNPFIGYLADKVSLRYFVIFAPAMTATLIGLMGQVPSYTSLVILFLMIGISVAAFHAPTPAMIARVSGKRVGLGMSLYMAGGELGRTIGPLVAVAGVAAWGLEGIWRLIIIGWGASVILFFRFRNVSSSQYRSKAGILGDLLPSLRTFFLPMGLAVLARAFLIVSMTTYLPTFLNMEGNTLAMAGIALAVLEGAGVVGALVSGTVSDRLGRKPVLLVMFVMSSVLMFLFLEFTLGWMMFVVLVLFGFFSVGAQPVMLAMVQDFHPENRAVANGLFMALNFLLTSAVMLSIGAAGDVWGLRTTFLLSAGVSVLAVASVFLLPGSFTREKTG